MIMIVDFGIIHLFLDAVFLQGMDFFGLGGERGELGSDDPIIKGTIATMFAVTGFGVLLNMFNSGVRKKLVDQVKLKRIMRETRAWQKQRMAAFRSKDLEKQASLNKKSSYICKATMQTDLEGTATTYILYNVCCHTISFAFKRFNRKYW